MNAYYNLKGIGDVLLLPLKSMGDSSFNYEKYGDVTKITNEKGDLVGYNIFNASKHLTLEKEGTIVVSEKLFKELKSLFEEEGVEGSLPVDLTPKFVVGKVLSAKQHENAEKLKVCEVDVGEETLQIVCGAANVAEGQKVVVAKIGALMISGLEIKPTKLRGVESNGMICSLEELGLPNPKQEEGIHVLDDAYEVGEPFLFEG